MIIFDCLDRIKEKETELIRHCDEPERLVNECEFDKLMDSAEKGMRPSSDLFLTYRNLLLILYEQLPSHARDIGEADYASFRIMIEALDRIPGYKITLPFILPNKRNRKTRLSNALTFAVEEAVTRFCNENDVRPFEKSTIIFLSSYGGKLLTIDNDNLESGIIINSLRYRMIYDDNC